MKVHLVDGTYELFRAYYGVPPAHDAAGRPVFLEINPLPTFAPDGSFGILAELAGTTYEALVGDVLARGLARLGLA